MTLFIPHVIFCQPLCLFGPPDASLQLSDEPKIQIIALVQTGPAISSIYPSWAAAVVCCMYYWFLHLPMLKTVNIFHCKFETCNRTAWGTGFPTFVFCSNLPTSMQNWKEPGFPAWVVNGNIPHLMYSHVCSLRISGIEELSLSLLLPELLWLTATHFQTSINNILVVTKIINHYIIIIFTVISSTPELSEEL